MSDNEPTQPALPFPGARDGIELRHLRAFVAVAEELSFARAADRLYVSAPALSRQIRGLEQLIGTELLRRSTHRVELTVVGDALLDRARRLLVDVDEAVSTAMALGGELLGRVARVWKPQEGLYGVEPLLDDARAASEAMHSRIAQPAGTEVRPVIAGGTPSLLVTPPGITEATVLHLHGGAFVTASAYGYRPHGGALALSAQTGVLLPEFRLAPENPLPEGLEDSLAAYRWLLARGVPPERLTLSADATGASIALSLLLTLKAQHEPIPAKLVLFCPWVDLQPAREDPAAGPQVFNLDAARRCAAMYLGDHPPRDPIVDPLAADLSGLPPMLIQTATGDARLTDSRRLAARARDHGVDARLRLFPIDAHAFHLFWSFLPEAADAMDAAGAFIRDA